MRKLLVTLALSVAAFAASAAPLLATCNVVTDVEQDALACFNFGGNDDGAPNQVTVLGNLAGFNADAGNVAEAPWFHVQHFGEGPKNGTLTFNELMEDYFAVTLKAGNGYNAYLFDGGVLGTGSISYSIDKELSHANLWTFVQGSTFGGGECDLNPLAEGCSNNVPEPGSFALAGMALAGLAFTRKRRKTI